MHFKLPTLLYQGRARRLIATRTNSHPPSGTKTGAATAGPARQEISHGADGACRQHTGKCLGRDDRKLLFFSIPSALSQPMLIVPSSPSLPSPP